MLARHAYFFDTNPMEDLSDGAGPGSIGLTIAAFAIVGWVIWMSTRD